MNRGLKRIEKNDVKKCIGHLISNLPDNASNEVIQTIFDSVDIIFKEKKLTRPTNIADLKKLL